MARLYMTILKTLNKIIAFFSKDCLLKETPIQKLFETAVDWNFFDSYIFAICKKAGKKLLNVTTLSIFFLLETLENLDKNQLFNLNVPAIFYTKLTKN